MGSANSKNEKNEALSLCKHRRKFIKQAIDSRYSLAAAHVSYVQSLRNIGTALRRYAEAEVLIESSLSTSATELEKTPLHSSYPSPSPSHIADVSDSPLQNGSPVARMSYMRSGGSAAVTVMVNPVNNNFVQDEPVQPPPPPFETGSWDYFDTSDDSESFRFLGVDGVDINFGDVGGWGKEKNDEGRDCNSGATTLPRIKKSFSEISRSSEIQMKHHGQPKRIYTDSIVSGGNDSSHAELDGELKHDGGILANRLAIEPVNSKSDKTMVDKDLDEEREDPSEFITHRAKDFLSSIKYIEHRFVRASEAGREISRMLEVNKIRVGYSEAKGRPSASAFITAFQSLCPKGNGSLASRDSTQHMTKVITWKRSTSSLSSSSRNPLTEASKDDADDSGSDFVEEFCMIAGSHSSTLERLYAWERKLYDEVKASEIIRKEYDSKCDQLRHQFAKDQSTQIIDKTRAVVKDLHSRIRVALHSVDSISKRIEKMRDEELQPQLIEFIQGLIRMWKAMLECHHAQYITISLAYHSRSSAGIPQGESRRQILDQLQQEVECFGLSFTNWINSHTSYIEALNGWLQHCILEPRERCRGRRPFSPRRALAPPIFVLCRDWSAGIKALPSKELSDAIKSFLSDLHLLKEQDAEELLKKQLSLDQENGAETGCRDAEKNDDASSNLHCLHASLTKVLDRLTRFSEASLKMYEDIKQKSEAARIAYTNCRPVRF